MWKATVKLICAECGQEHTITEIYYNRREADSWENYMKGVTDHLCPACYGKMMREKASKARAEAAAKDAEAAAQKYYYEHNAPTEARTLIRVERNTKNPLPGLSFVSIAYYRNAAGAVYGIVF